MRSAVEAKDAKHKLNGQELRTNFKAKQSEKFGDNESKKTSGDEQEPSKRGSDPRRYQDVFIFTCLNVLFVVLLADLEYVLLCWAHFGLVACIALSNTRPSYM